MAADWIAAAGMADAAVDDDGASRPSNLFDMGPRYGMLCEGTFGAIDVLGMEPVSDNIIFVLSLIHISEPTRRS